MISIKAALRAAVAGPALAALAATTLLGGGAAMATTAAATTTVHRCTTAALKVSLGRPQGAAGSTYLPIDYLNVTHQTCTLYGFPGVSFAGGSPLHQIGLSASRDYTRPPRLVYVRPGRSAYTMLRITNALNYPPSVCRPVRASHLKVYPPNTYTPVYLRYSVLACSKPVRQMSVQVARYGTGS